MIVGYNGSNDEKKKKNTIVGYNNKNDSDTLNETVRLYNAYNSNAKGHAVTQIPTTNKTEAVKSASDNLSNLERASRIGNIEVSDDIINRGNKIVKGLGKSTAGSAYVAAQAAIQSLGEHFDRVRENGMADALSTYARNLDNPNFDFESKPLDTSTWGFKKLDEANKLYSEALEGLNPAQQFLGQSGISILDNLSTLPLVAVHPSAPLIAMSAKATGTKAYELGKEGKSATEALGRGLVSGAVEGMTERLPLDELLDVIKHGGKVGQAALKQALSEGGEEALSYLLNLGADKLAGDDVDFSLAELGLSGLGGFVSGGLMGTGGAMVGNLWNSSTYKNIGQKIVEDNIVEEVIQTGLESAPDTESHKLAQQLQSKIEAGETVDEVEIGELYIENTKAIEEEEKTSFKASYLGQNEDVPVDDKLTAETPNVAEIGSQEVTQPINNVVLTNEDKMRIEAQRRANEVGFENAIRTLGDNGAKVLGSTYKLTDNFDKFYKDFSTYYEAGSIGTPMDLIDSNYSKKVDTQLKLSAYMAGQKDAEVSFGRDKANAKVYTNGEFISGTAPKNVSSDTLAVLNSLAKATGNRIRFEDKVYGGKANGQYLNGEITIAKDAEKPFYVVAKHEVTHGLQVTSPVEYRAYRNYAVELAEKTNGRSISVVEQYKLRAKNAGINLTTEQAMDEIAADFTEKILKDGKTLEQFIEENIVNSKSMLQKFFDAVHDFIKKVKAAFNGNRASMNKAAIKEFGLTISELEKVEKMWLNAVKATYESSKNAQQNKVSEVSADVDNTHKQYSLKDSSQAEEINNSIEAVGISYDAETESVAPQFSLKTWNESDKVKAVKDLSKALGISEAEAQKYIDDVNGVAKYIANHKILDYESNDIYTAMKPNSDYKYTIDFSTLCKKRLLQTGTIDAIQHKLPNAVLTSDDYVRIRQLMKDKGYEVACGLCYVESRRRMLDSVAKGFIDKYMDGKSGLNVDDLTTTDGITSLMRTNRDAYDAFVLHNNARGMNKINLVETRVAYNENILKLTDKTVKALNAMGGLRVQSFSDFEMVHLIDMMQVVLDMSKKGLKSQAYTKVPAFAELMGNTGMKVNLSLIAKGVGYDSKGRLLFDDVEGMPFKTAMKLRNKFSKNVGTILVGINDRHIELAMADDRIDYIIPYHRSGWAQSEYEALGISGYEDYTKTQNEKLKDPYQRDKNGDVVLKKNGKPKEIEISNIYPSEYWDDSKTGEENAKRYLELCEEKGRIPKFPQFAYDAKGNVRKGYWKLLIDFKMYDNDGVGSPQVNVQPNFDTKAINKIMKDYVKSEPMPANKLPVAQDIVDEFVAEYKESGRRFSLKDSDGGYVGQSMSKRAKAAYAFGEMPLSKWTKTAILEEVSEIVSDDVYSAISSLKADEMKKHLLIKSSWHHTGALYNETDFYKLDTKYIENLDVEDIEEIKKSRRSKTKAEIEEEKQTKDFNKMVNDEYDRWNNLFENQRRHKTFGGFVRWAVKQDASVLNDMEDSIIESLIKDVSKKVEAWRKLPDNHWRQSDVKAFENDAAEYVRDKYFKKGFSQKKDLKDMISEYLRNSKFENVTLYSLEDSNGNQLTEAQAEFFKDSKVRDENGNLKVVYHGTKATGFTVFEVAKDFGYFFTDVQDTAWSYSGSYNKAKVYNFKTWDDAIKEAKVQGFTANVDENGNYVFNDGWSKMVYSPDELRYFSDEFTELFKGDKGIYEAYLNLKNPLIIDGHGSSWDAVADYQEGLVTWDELSEEEQDVYIEEFGDKVQYYDDAPIFNPDVNDPYYTEVQSTRDWVREAISSGAEYDGVIFKNIVDEGEFGRGYGSEANVYVVFNSNQIKSTDNLNPTDDPDIRFSLKGTSDILKENAQLKEYNEYLKSQMKLTKEIKVDQKELKRLVNSLAKEYGTTMPKDEMFKRLDELYTYMQNEKELTFDDAKERAIEVARDIVSESVAVDDDLYNRYVEIRDFIRKTRITLSEEDRKSVAGGYNNFRKANMGRLNLANDGISVDRFYQQLSEMYPDIFDAEKYTYPADQLENIVDELNRLRNAYEYNPYDADTQSAVEWMANDLIDRYFDVPQAKPTYADKQKAKYDKQRRTQVSNAIKREREFRDKRLSELRKEKNNKIKEIRKKRDEKIKALKEAQKKRVAKMSDKRKRKILRDRIARHTKDLSTRLLEGSDKSHIPQELRQTVVTLLDAINLESAYSKDPETGKLKKNIEGNPTKRTNALRKLKEQYKEIIKTEYETGMVIDPALLGDKENGSMFDAVIRMKDTRVSDMTLEELETVWKVIRAVEKSITSAGKTLSDSKYATTKGWAEAFKNNTSDRKERKSNWFKNISVDLETPYTFFAHFGQAGKDFFRMLRNAQDKQQVLQSELAEIVQKVVSKEKREALEKDIVEYTTEKGEKLMLSKAHLMEIYLLSKRKQARGHLLGDGIVQPKIKGKVSEGVKGILLTENDLNDMEGLLNAEEKKIADGLQKATLFLAEKGNEASMLVFGYEKFNDPNYWTIKSSSLGLDQTVDKGQNQPRSIKNMGSAKGLTENARNSLSIGGVFDTFDAHASDMITYSAWLAPMEDANRLFNFSFRDANKKPTGEKLKGILRTYAGEKAEQYWLNLMKDIQNGIAAIPDDNISPLIERIIGKVKGAAVASNIRVVVQQPTSFIRAGIVLSPDNMLLGMTKGVNKGNGWEKAKKYAPIAQMKAVGGFEVSNSPTQLSEVLYAPETKKGKVLEGVKELPTMGASKADAMTWGAIWNACEWQVHKSNESLDVGSDEFNKAVAELFTEVIDQTQVVDGVLQRSQIMRSSKDYNKQATSFMGEPTLSLNLLMRSYDNWKSQTDPKKRTEARKKMGQAVFTLMLSNFVVAVAQSSVDGLRDDDEEKKYLERFLSALTGIQGDEESLSEIGKNMLLDGNLGESMNVAAWIPYVKDIFSILQGYDVERLDATAISDFVSAANNSIKSLSGEGKWSKGYALSKMFMTGAKLFGSSASNVVRDVESIVRSVFIETENWKALYDMKKQMYNIKTQKGEFMDVLYKAYEDNLDDYTEMYNDLLEQGISEKDIKSAMESRMKKAQNVDSVYELEERWFSPSQQKETESVMNSARKSSLWNKASQTQKTEFESRVYEILNDKETQTKMKEIGMDTTDYALFNLALSVYDEPNKNGNYGTYTNKETAEAILNTPNITDKEMASLWNWEMDDDNILEALAKGYDIDTYLELKADTTGLKKAEKRKYLNDMDISDDEYKFYRELLKL